MQIVVFGPESRVGVLRAGQVIDLHAADSRIPASLSQLVAMGGAGLEGADRVCERAEADAPWVHSAASVRLGAPVADHGRIACAGGNYAVHLAGAQAARTGVEVSPEEIYETARRGTPWGFWKVASVGGPDQPLPYPARATRLDYEGEVAVMIGKRGHDIAVDRVAEHIWGVTLFNDWSIRNDMGPARVLNFNLAKNFDGSTTVGPCVVAGEAALDPQALDVELKVNGEVRQHYSTRDMIFSFAEIVSYLSRDLTLEPGDLIAGGTGSGTAMDTTRPGPDGVPPGDRFLHVGDVVELASPPIGVLRNQVVARS